MEYKITIGNAVLQGNVTKIPSNTQYPPLWRVKHDAERGEIWRVHVPEVFPLNPDHRIPMNEPEQLLLFGLLRSGAPSLSLTEAKKQFRILYDYRRAFTNKYCGFEGIGEPLADYINRLNLKDSPMCFDKPRVCGGASITGKVIGSELEIETINADAPIPSLEWVLEHPWLYFHATTIADESGNIGRFPQGGGEPVFVPLISRHSKGKLRISLNDLVKLPENSPPANPYIF